MVTIELYGVPRLRAGIGRLVVEGTSLGAALRALAVACPALDGSVIVDGVAHAAYKVSLNGDRFVTDPETPLADGDAVLLLAADVGG